MSASSPCECAARVNSYSACHPQSLLMCKRRLITMSPRRMPLLLQQLQHLRRRLRYVDVGAVANDELFFRLHAHVLAVYQLSLARHKPETVIFCKHFLFARHVPDQMLQKYIEGRRAVPQHLLAQAGQSLRNQPQRLHLQLRQRLFVPA